LDAGKAVGVLKVMVVDDHLVFAEALAMAIESHEELTCVATALDINDAVDLADELQPGVAVIDVELDGGDVAGTRRLLERHPELHVLVLTGEPLSRELVHEVARAGAAGLLRKTSSVGQVVETIRALGNHSFAIDRTGLTALLQPDVGGGRDSRNQSSAFLTRREQEILLLLASGVDLQSAAARLGITANTARGYVKNLYRKLGVHSQLELLAVARDRGLLDAAG